tara:strand:+ start:122 stop:382 length:261 start_codon:yes stop_codon:yes gene_type:complete
MEYIVGPVLALLLGLKFTDYKVKQTEAAMETQYMELINEIEEKVFENSKDLETKILDNNGVISQQTLKLMVPVVTNVQKINSQLGL